MSSQFDQLHRCTRGDLIYLVAFMRGADPDLWDVAAAARVVDLEQRPLVPVLTLIPSPRDV